MRMKKCPVVGRSFVALLIIIIIIPVVMERHDDERMERRDNRIMVTTETYPSGGDLGSPG